MKINPFGNIGQIGPKNVSEIGRTKPGFAECEVKSANRTDEIKISAAGAFKSEVEAMAKVVTASIEGPTRAEKLAQIEQRVKAGTYYVSTEELTDALMERWIGR